MTTPLLKLEDVKARLPIRTGVTTYDTRITEVIAAVSAQCEAWCRRSLKAQTHTHYFDVASEPRAVMSLHGDTEYPAHLAPGAQCFTLPDIPNGAVEVRYDPARLFPGTSVVATDKVVTVNARVYVDAVMRRGQDVVRIAYAAGFAEADGSLSAALPADLKLAAIEQALAVYSALEAEAEGTDEKKKPKRPVGLLPQLQMALAPYRRITARRV